jgi:hypothetical protein
VVYMAEQEEPIRRRVVLKIIKPGMDTRQVIARAFVGKHPLRHNLCLWRPGWLGVRDPLRPQN